MKYATDEAMRTGMTLQKGYIDNGDSTNARALDDAKRELKASIDQNSHDIESVSKKVDLITGPIHYYVAKYAKGSNDNTEISHLGNKDILKNFGFVLLDTSDNKNITTKPKRLKDNNLFRFEDGTFAPTVGITTEQYNQCMANDIYSGEVNESGKYVYTLEYRAGEFDAAAQWEKDKAIIKSGIPSNKRLYTRVPGSVGDTSSSYKLVTHVLRPWETTETKYTIGIANLVDMYLLDNQVGDSGAYWKGIFLEPVSWDGIDVTKHKLPPTAIGPCPVTTIQENGLIKTRNFFYLYKGMTNCQSDGGLLPNHDFWEKNRTYPRVNDMNQVNNMRYARNNNYDVTKPYPFAEGGYHATNVFITALELLAGTRYLHKANLFGSGISSNDGCNEGNFHTSGGVRFHAQGDTQGDYWTYKNLGIDSSPLEYHFRGSTSRMSQVIYNDYPIEQCMESQMAASMATELGINPTTDPASPNYFDFYGNTYYYMNVPGFDGLQEGRMNTRVYKYIHKSEVSAYKDQAATTFEVDVILRMSLFNGANLSGDISAYNGGGLEIVGSCTVDPDNFDYENSFVGNKIDIYVEPDQTKWHSETVISKNGLDQVFGFEALYRHVLETTNLGDSYTLTREGFTPWKTANASSMVQGECYYQLDYNAWGSLNQRVRTGLLFRSISSGRECSHRAIDTREDASYTYRYHSGSAQALIEL